MWIISLIMIFVLAIIGACTLTIIKNPQVKLSICLLIAIAADYGMDKLFDMGVLQ